MALTSGSICFQTEQLIVPPHLKKGILLRSVSLSMEKHSEEISAPAVGLPSLELDVVLQSSRLGLWLWDYSWSLT